MKRLRSRYACGVELALDVLGGKWKPVILARLKEAPLRYGELRRRIPNLSDKMLSERLRDLETQGLIGRDAAGVYALTPRGESLRPALQALYDWGVASAAELKVQVAPPTA
jgi:DNA-binding HxlR family transcriptional regulator